MSNASGHAMTMRDPNAAFDRMDVNRTERSPATNSARARPRAHGEVLRR